MASRKDFFSFLTPISNRNSLPFLLLPMNSIQCFQLTTNHKLILHIVSTIRIEQAEEKLFRSYRNLPTFCKPTGYGLPHIRCQIFPLRKYVLLTYQRVRMEKTQCQKTHQCSVYQLHCKAK